MRLPIQVLALVGVAVALMASGARAYQMPYDPYPWCAEYGGSMSGSSNCGFTTWEQCMATVSGIGGGCVRNQFYNPGGSAKRGKASKKRSDHRRYDGPPTPSFWSPSGSWPSYFHGD